MRHNGTYYKSICSTFVRKLAITPMSYSGVNVKAYTCTVFYVLSYLIWVVPIQTECRATIVICSHITTVPEASTRVITTVPGGIQGLLPLFQRASTRVITTVPEVKYKGYYHCSRGHTRVITLFQGAYRIQGATRSFPDLKRR